MRRSNSAGANVPGIFVTLEGGEGVGKSTHTRRIAAKLDEIGISALATREPGGSPLAETLRDLLLSGAAKRLGPAGETFLFSAARIDHLEAVINPALSAGTWVICDRFMDSTRAYQGVLGSLDHEFLEIMEKFTLQGILPDLTFILDLPAEIGLQRAGLRRGKNVSMDRFEAEDLDFHQRLRKAFLDIAIRDAKRCIVIDGLQAEIQVFDTMWNEIERRFLKSSQDISNGP
jgi:dTMP kinase